MVYLRVFIFTLFFPVALHAQDKFQLELLTQNKPFVMKVGESQKIEFTATTSAGDFHYGIFLKHADEPPWNNGSGPLTLKPIKLEQGKNTFSWDGQSFAWAPTDVPEMGKLKKGFTNKYFFKILIFDTSKVQFLGMLADYHKHSVASLRSKNFTIEK